MLSRIRARFAWFVRSFTPAKMANDPTLTGLSGGAWGSTASIGRARIARPLGRTAHKHARPNAQRCGILDHGTKCRIVPNDVGAGVCFATAICVAG